MPDHPQNDQSASSGLIWYPLYTGTWLNNMTGELCRKRGMPCKHRTKGVYLIRENGLVIYVGQSGHCVKKRCYRKFEAGYCYQGGRVALNYSENIDIMLYQVAYIPASDPVMRTQLEAELIRRFDPRDNVQMPELPSEVIPAEDIIVPF